MESGWILENIKICDGYGVIHTWALSSFPLINSPMSCLPSLFPSWRWGATLPQWKKSTTWEASVSFPSLPPPDFSWLFLLFLYIASSSHYKDIKVLPKMIQPNFVPPFSFLAFTSRPLEWPAQCLLFLTCLYILACAWSLYLTFLSNRGFQAHLSQ